MAKPIEPTPTLSGKDRDLLLKEIDESRYDATKAAFFKSCDEVYASTKR